MKTQATVSLFSTIWIQIRPSGYICIQLNQSAFGFDVVVLNMIFATFCSDSGLQISVLKSLVQW